MSWLDMFLVALSSSIMFLYLPKPAVIGILVYITCGVLSSMLFREEPREPYKFRELYKFHEPRIYEPTIHQLDVKPIFPSQKRRKYT